MSRAFLYPEQSFEENYDQHIYGTMVGVEQSIGYRVRCSPFDFWLCVFRYRESHHQHSSSTLGASFALALFAMF